MKCIYGDHRIHHLSVSCPDYAAGRVSIELTGHDPSCVWEGYIAVTTCGCSASMNLKLEIKSK